MNFKEKVVIFKAKLNLDKKQLVEYSYAFLSTVGRLRSSIVVFPNESISRVKTFLIDFVLA